MFLDQGMAKIRTWLLVPTILTAISFTNMYKSILISHLIKPTVLAGPNTLEEMLSHSPRMDMMVPFSAFDFIPFTPEFHSHRDRFDLSLTSKNPPKEVVRGFLEGELAFVQHVPEFFEWTFRSDRIGCRLEPEDIYASNTTLAISFLAPVAKKNYSKSEFFNVHVMRLFQFGFTRSDQSDEEQTIFKTKENYPKCRSRPPDEQPETLNLCVPKEKLIRLGIKHFLPLIKAYAYGILIASGVFLIELSLTLVLWAIKYVQVKGQSGK